MTDSTTTETELPETRRMAPPTIQPSWLAEVPRLLEEVEFTVVGVLDDVPAKLPRQSQGPLPLASDLALLVDVLDLVARKAAELRDAAAVGLCKSVPFGTTLVQADGLPPMEPHWSKNRTAWKNADLAAAVRRTVLEAVDHAVVDPETGELASAGDIMAATYDTVTSVVSVTGSNAKTTGLRKLGLDPDDFCTSEPKDPTVRIIRG